MGRLREERSLVRGGDGRVCWRAAGDGLLLAGVGDAAGLVAGEDDL